jgi:hypothetical protein
MRLDVEDGYADRSKPAIERGPSPHDDELEKAYTSRSSPAAHLSARRENINTSTWKIECDGIDHLCISLFYRHLPWAKQKNGTLGIRSKQDFRFARKAIVFE